MSVRCKQQSPPSAPADCESERLSLGAVVFAVAVALLFYTCRVTVAAGAACGCAAALCIARSHRVRSYAALLKLYLQGAGELRIPHRQRACGTCGAADCARHDPRLAFEPWAGLRVHKQLDQAIENFYNAILERFVGSWYGHVSRRPHFLQELREQLRHASASLLRRAYKINYAKLIVDRLVPCALHHHGVWTEARRQALRSDDAARSCQQEHERLEAAALAGPLRGRLHPAATSRAAELRYLRCLTAAIMPHLLRDDELQSRVFQVLIREIFAGWVLLSLTDVLADPYILNTLIVLATGDETMSALPKTPNYRVEFLEKFAGGAEPALASRSQLLRLDLDTVLASQDLLYAFMHYMRSAGHLHLLQFCKDMKPFQMKILNPELTSNEEVSLFNEAWDLYVQYFDADSPSAIPFQPSVVEEMRAVLSEGPANVKKLQTSKALYESSKYGDSLLQNVFIPKFLHSEEFYKVFIGPRAPTGYHKTMRKKSQDKLVSTAIRLGSKLKGALRSQTVDGQILDCFTNTVDVNSEVTDGDGIENMDILRYLDSLAEHTKLEEHDLRNWRITLTHAETRQLEGKRGGGGGGGGAWPVRVFTIAVQRAVPLCASERGWEVERTEHDFHLLRAKLTEFHGDALLQGLSLPSRRDNSPLETLRYKYEDYVQRLLQTSLLSTSELLRIFLSADGDFALAVQRASLGAGGPDLANIYQSVAHRLRKEKGQHLEPFMNAFLLSSDMERYQAMKQGSSQPVEEAEEVAETEAGERGAAGGSGGAGPRRRDTFVRTFGDNFGEPRSAAAARAPRGGRAHQRMLAGFTQCLMYFLVKVVRARGALVAALGCVAALARDLIDNAFNLTLNSVLADVLSHQRLAHLIWLGHELLFLHGPARRQHTDAEQRERARAQLLARTPRLLALALARDPAPALRDLHDMLQSARLNKQLVYSLLDLCIAELFPELIEDSASPDTS